MLPLTPGRPGGDITVLGERIELVETLEPFQKIEAAPLTIEASKTQSTPPKTASEPASNDKCEEWINSAGIRDFEKGYARELIRRESNCNPGAINPETYACGIAQELLEPRQRDQQIASVKAGRCPKSGCSLTDGQCQVKWMRTYIETRYIRWEAAVSHHDRHNWY